MCMGMMNYREQENGLTTIICKGCGRAWQTSQAGAEQFKEQCDSLCNACRNKSKETVSLLKRKTNFDKLKDLSAWDFAGKIDEFVQGDCDMCPFSTLQGDVQECRLLDDRPSTCRQKYTQWLESEAE